MSIAALPRPCLRDVSPYLPGKPIAEVQRELGIRKVVKLASNENPLGPSPRALAEVRRAARESNIYPEGASPLLRRALARRHGLAEGQVLIGNGSDEIIRLLCEAFLSPEDEVVVSRCGFIRFKQHAMLMGARVIEVPMAGWTHDLGAMSRALTPRTKMLFVASPNNPTGTYNTRAQVEGLLSGLPKNVLLVLDEAYAEYAAPRPDYPDSVRELLPGRSNLVILRTFSKAYGLAGLRVGYGLADAGMLGWLDRIRMPFNVSLPAQRAALEGLKDEAFVRRSVALMERQRPAVADALRRLGFKVADSAANFLFVESAEPGKALFKRLLHRGVIVRPLEEYGLDRHVRITVGTAEQNKWLLNALRSSPTTASPPRRGGSA